jgi:hypothetical protein
MGPWQHALLAGSNERSLPQPRRSRRRLIVAGVVTMLLALPVGVYASHDFSDVPTSNTFHAVISTLYGSRITGGCGSGKYCPNASVTRGQMAAFLVRGLGRMATVEDGADDDWAELTQPAPSPTEPHPYGVVAPLSFRHGGGAGGTAYVYASGTVNVWTDEAGVCPCEVQAFLFNNDTGEFSQTYFGMIGSEFAPIDPDLSLIPGLTPTAFSETTLTLSFAFSVDAGVINDYAIAAKVIPTTAPTDTPPDAFNTGWSATLQTVYVPFNENGQNPSAPVTSQSKPDHSRGHRTK